MKTIYTRQRSQLVWVLLLLFSIQVVAQEKQKKEQPQRPEFIPERIILSVTADPAHTQAVTWRTEKAESAARGQIAEASANPDFEKSATAVSAKTTEAEVSSGKLVGEYAVKFEGLKPNTQYSYRVGDGTTWSEWNTFRTASDRPDAFRFIYVGDAQNSIKSMWSRAIRAAYSKAPDARFIVHAGDLVQEGYDDNLWGEWCDAMGFISAEVPSLPTPGNHDEHRLPGSADSKEVLSVSPLWRYHFSLPANGPEGVPELNQHPTCGPRPANPVPTNFSGGSFSPFSAAMATCTLRTGPSSIRIGARLYCRLPTISSVRVLTFRTISGRPVVESDR